MTEQTEKPVAPKPSRDFWSWIYWPVVVAVLYVLVSGPGQALCNRPQAPVALCRAFSVAYTPLLRAYDHPFLRKPLGMYWHLWEPGVFDKAGNIRPGDERVY
jgi:hypothetical protein